MVTLAILAVTILFLFIPKMASAAVVLNEIMANAPSEEKEWIELYNTSSAMNISGWVVEEKTGPNLSGTKQHLLPDFTIQNNAFWTFDFATASLNNNGDTITLKDNSGNIVDTYQYTSSTKSKTFGRQPDGGTWASSLDPTKGSSNGDITPTPTPTSTPSPLPTPTPSPTTTPTSGPATSKAKSSPTTTKSPTPQPTTSPATPFPTKTPTNASKPKSTVAAVTASATPSAIAEVKSEKRLNFLPWIGVMLVICGVGSLIYIYLRQGRLHEILHHLFRK